MITQIKTREEMHEALVRSLLDYAVAPGDTQDMHSLNEAIAKYVPGLKIIEKGGTKKTPKYSYSYHSPTLGAMYVTGITHKTPVAAFEYACQFINSVHDRVAKHLSESKEISR
jgi:hypothetical protein